MRIQNCLLSSANLNPVSRSLTDEKNYSPFKIQHLEDLDLINNIHTDNTQVQTTNTVKILGYTFNFIKTSSTHIANITQKAKMNIHKLYRFKTAPAKIKKHLYKALIRPILEYPATQINSTDITNKHKIQTSKAYRL